MDRKQPLPDPQRKDEASRQRGDGETLRTDDEALEDQSTEAAGYVPGRQGMPENDRGFLRDDGQSRPAKGDDSDARLDEGRNPATQPTDDRAPATPDTAGADTGPRKASSGDDANPKPKTTNELDDAYSNDDAQKKAS